MGDGDPFDNDEMYYSFYDGEQESYADEVSYGRRSSRAKTCKHCGESGLWWTETKKGWRLKGSDGIHRCLKMPRTCNNCGEDHLVWKKVDDGWRLAYTDGTIHYCSRPEPDEVFVKFRIECNGDLCGECKLVDRVPHPEWGFVYYCRPDHTLLYTNEEAEQTHMTGEPDEWKLLRRSDACFRAERKCREENQ
jgi:hypothetical protein